MDVIFLENKMEHIKFKYIFAIFCLFAFLTTVTMIVTFVDVEQESALIECDHINKI